MGHDNERVDREGMTAPRRGDSLAQASHLVNKQRLPSLQ
jgi:hypothetical protein